MDPGAPGCSAAGEDLPEWRSPLGRNGPSVLSLAWLWCMLHGSQRCPPAGSLACQHSPSEGKPERRTLKAIRIPKPSLVL